jgi:DNA polymerase-3 subunit beta
MKITCLRENLSQGLGVVGRAVSSRSTLPVLGNVLLATEAGRLKLAATDLEVGISCWIGAKVDEDGAITVPARTLTDLVNALPSGAVDIELDERRQKLSLRADHTRANLNGIDAQEFPGAPLPEGKDGVLVEADVLRAAIGQVAFAASPDESRQILTGVLVQFEDTQLTLAAADGFRLAVRTVPSSQPVSDPFSIIVPARALTELARISGEQQEPIVVTVTPNRNQVIFRLTDSVLASQLIDGRFPDYRQIIPADRATRAVVDTAAFLKACKTALIFARNGGNIARLRVEPGSEASPSRVVVSAASAETGDDKSEIQAGVEGEAVEIAFNVKYLIDVLSVVGTPQVALDTTASSNPGVIRPVGNERYVHVIMPMHLGR